MWSILKNAVYGPFLAPFYEDIHVLLAYQWLFNQPTKFITIKVIFYTYTAKAKLDVPKIMKAV